ncbi:MULTISPECIES: hypothetical protein [unclassified Streptomyces]|uniref:hypothetical protein n=1 Tax=unclassified Streptomyces TaxID=2593676 RepID=UPI00081E6D05|nr:MULTISPECIES: hypothetical protein [unclassified Streptomyces]MYR25810.1 hypothetical protein [Streptomyces sp. SID4945]SCE89076.1 hypothetical protein GA0115257_103939 [Streptomyces sp. LcepLS]
MGVPEPSPSRPLRRRRLLRYGAALTVSCALAGYLVVRFGPDAQHARPGCEVVSADGGRTTYSFGADQAVNAATIAAVGTSRGMPERAVTIALATALQESGLRNLDHGDRDSVGLFQQRPSQGWGTVAQIMDPVYSAGKFYQRLDKVDGYASLPLTVAAQKVQRSAFPDAYAKHEPDAALLAAALTGRAAASLTCESTVPDGTGDPSAVRAALIRDFGAGVLPEAPEARQKATAAATTASPSPVEGTFSRGGAPARTRTVVVPVAGAGTAKDAKGAKGAKGAKAAKDGRRGWELAQWAVAHASVLHLSEVAYAGREWRASGTGHTWREVAADKGDGGAGGAKGAGGPADVRIVTAP